MRFVRFDQSLSRLRSFDTIGYDIQSQTLRILFFDGRNELYCQVPEQTIFEWLTSGDKEDFFQDRIRLHYPKKDKAETIID